MFALMCQHNNRRFFTKQRDGICCGPMAACNYEVWWDVVGDVEPEVDDQPDGKQFSKDLHKTKDCSGSAMIG